MLVGVACGAGSLVEGEAMIDRDFILAGKAIFTVANAGGKHYTFRVTHKEASGAYAEAWFLSLLTGPDNTSDYTYVGMLSDRGLVRLTAKSKYNEQSEPVRVARWALSIVWWGGELPEGYAINHEGRCCRCGRTLTTPSSIEAGIGPECAEIMAGA